MEINNNLNFDHGQVDGEVGGLERDLDEGRSERGWSNWQVW